MTRPLIQIHNGETDEVVIREMNDEEYAQYQIDAAHFAELKAQEEAAEEAKIQAAIDKAALLERLGITEAEAKLLLS
jgi:hypothetical protein